MLQRAPHVVFTRLDEDWLAFDSEAGYCYSLNEVAGCVWDMLDRPMALQAVCDRLCVSYVVDEETCRRDVLALLQQLAAFGLVQVIER